MFTLGSLFSMFFTYTIEMIIAGILLIKDKLKFRFKPYISIPVSLLIAFGSSLIVILSIYFFPDVFKWNEFNNILAYTIPFIGVIFAFYFAYNRSLSRIIITMCVAYTFQSAAYQITTLILDTGLQWKIISNLGEEWYNSYYPIISNVVTYGVKILTYVLSYFIVAKAYIKYYKYIFKNVSVVVLGLLSYLVVNVVNAYAVHHLWFDPTMRGIMCITLLVFCGLFDTLVVGGFKFVESQQEAIVIKTALNGRMREQEMMENNINFINMKCHDLRKELRALKAKKESLKDEDFALLEESLNFYDSSVKTGNFNIDALIQDKLIYCNSVGIELTSLVDGNAFENMASSDIFFLLTNILDNAIEAVEQIKNKEHRIISLTASKKHGVLVIEQSNYYEGNIVVNADKSIDTTKENKKYHGFGTKSIAYIVKKYEGKIDIDTENNIFKLTIAI